MTRTFWISFADDADGTTTMGDRLRGVCVVEVTDADAAAILPILEREHPKHLPGAEWLAAALRKAYKTGCNPGGQVCAWDITEALQSPDAPQDLPRDRLISRQELNERGLGPDSKS